MYSVVENFVGLVSEFLYTYWLVFALILCGLYLSFRTGFIQPQLTLATQPNKAWFKRFQFLLIPW